jgi:hypothetical protein
LAGNIFLSMLQKIIIIINTNAFEFECDQSGGVQRLLKRCGANTIGGELNNEKI